MNKTTFAVALSLFCLTLSAVNVFMAGDSTMATYPDKSKPMAGWGEVMQLFAKENVTVYNKAVGGRSSKSFRNEGRWAWIMARVKKGDFVVIQFGHNDASRGEKYLYRFADPEKAFPENMRNYIRDVKAKGAFPVIVPLTAVCRYNDKAVAFNSKTQQAYADAARRVAQEEGAAFIDLNSWMLRELTRIGKAKAEELVFMHLPKDKYPAYPNGRKDNTHLKYTGAMMVAQAVIQMAKDAKMPFGELFNSTPATK